VVRCQVFLDAVEVAMGLLSKVRETLFCSFCLKSDRKVERLIGGPSLRCPRHRGKAITW
jgi:hypothetical protein